MIENELQAFKNVPDVGSLLIFDTDEGRFRAVRVPDNFEGNSFDEAIKIILLDTGIQYNVDINYGFYKMPKNLENIPALAIQCQLTDVSW